MEKEYNGVEILIAEDNPVNYTLLKELVHHNGIEHFWAKNGLETLEILTRHHNISLILMDINMPEMDGITATKQIRGRGIKIPIIFQTAYDSEEDRKECFKAGGNEFLSKPIIRETLNILLKKYLSTARSRQP